MLCISFVQAFALFLCLTLALVFFLSLRHFAQAGTVRVPTPYHWLEHPEADEVKSWVDAQNKVTDAHLATCADKKKIEDVRL